MYQQARWRIADQFRKRTRASPHPQPLSHPMGEGGQRPGEGETDYATSDALVFLERSRVIAPEVDPAFERLWAAEWEGHLRQCALARVKRQVSGRQFQLFDLHVLQGLSVRVAATAAGTTIAAVYMAKSRVGRLVRREIARLRDLEL